MAHSLFIPITLLTESGEAQPTGILPYTSLPDVIVWRNRVFVASSQDAIYRETSFAVTGELGPVARLENCRGFVADVAIPYEAGVIRWGERIFRKMSDRIYSEAFFALAHNLETGLPEIFVETASVS